MARFSEESVARARWHPSFQAHLELFIRTLDHQIELDSFAVEDMDELANLRDKLLELAKDNGPASIASTIWPSVFAIDDPALKSLMQDFADTLEDLSIPLPDEEPFFVSLEIIYKQEQTPDAETVLAAYLPVIEGEYVSGYFRRQLPVLEVPQSIENRPSSVWPPSDWEWKSSIDHEPNHQNRQLTRVEFPLWCGSLGRWITWTHHLASHEQRPRVNLARIMVNQDYSLENIWNLTVSLRGDVGAHKFMNKQFPDLGNRTPPEAIADGDGRQVLGLLTGLRILGSRH